MFSKHQTTGGRPGKTEPRAMMYLRSDTFLLYSCKAASELKKSRQDWSDVERSVVSQFMLEIGSTLTYLRAFQECATPPHAQVHHCT